MKKIFGSILAVFALASVGQSASLVYSGIMQSTNGLATSPAAASTTTYTQDINQSGGDIIGAQLNYSSAVIPNVPFTDGSASTFTITVVSTQATVGIADQDTITVANNSALTLAPASTLVSISSNSPGALNGSIITVSYAKPVGATVLNASKTFVGGVDFIVGASSNATAISLAATINTKLNKAGGASFPGYLNTDFNGLLATVNPVGGSTVTLVTNSSGSFDNVWTIQVSTIALNVPGSSTSVVNFTGGQDNASFSFFSAITNKTITLTNGQQWVSDPVYSSNTAVSIANAWNLSGGYGETASTTSAAVVTFTANQTGAFENANLFSASTSALTVNNNSFLGQDAARFQIGNVFFASGVSWPVPLTSSTTANLATAIATAITSSGAGFTAQAIGSVVTSTASSVGVPSAIASSTQSALTIAPFVSSSPVTGIAVGTSFGGTNSNYIIQTPTITVTGHNLQTGIGVWLSTGTGIAPAPLVWGTTYYAIRIDANNFALATSLANANAGTFITFTSSQTKTSADNFTLNTIGLSGTPIFTLQGSIDGVLFAPVTAGENGGTIAQASFPSPYTTGSTNWAIGTFPWRFLRLNYSGPTTGGTNFSFYVNQKTSSSAR